MIDFYLIAPEIYLIDFTIMFNIVLDILSRIEVNIGTAFGTGLVTQDLIWS